MGRGLSHPRNFSDAHPASILPVTFRTPGPTSDKPQKDQIHPVEGIGGSQSNETFGEIVPDIASSHVSLRMRHCCPRSETGEKKSNGKNEAAGIKTPSEQYEEGVSQYIEPMGRSDARIFYESERQGIEVKPEPECHRSRTRWGVRTGVERPFENSKGEKALLFVIYWLLIPFICF